MLSISHERVLQRGRIRIWIAAPFIYGIVIPAVFLDFSITLYQAVCFRAYGIPLVPRRKYVRLQWRGNGMIKWIDRFNCMYCSYANGVLAYARVVAMETEKYWCPIKYAAGKGFTPPHAQPGYVESGDAKSLEEVVKTG